MMDLICENKEGVTLADLEWIHMHKTAALLKVCGQHNNFNVLPTAYTIVIISYVVVCSVRILNFLCSFILLFPCVSTIYVKHK